MRLCRWWRHDFRPRFSDTLYERRDVDGTYLHFRVRTYEGEVCAWCGDPPTSDAPVRQEGRDQ